MKVFATLILLLVTGHASSKPLDYYKQFFDEVVDLTHDPDFPTSGIATAYNDPYEVVMTGQDQGIGVMLSFSLKHDGRYSFWYLPIRHRWKEGQRQIRFGKCHAFNGRWGHRDGSLYLDHHIKLDPIYKQGRNFLTPTFLDLRPPPELKNLVIHIEKTARNDFGLDPGERDTFDCKGFWLPFWIPIPNER